MLWEVHEGLLALDDPGRAVAEALRDAGGPKALRTEGLGDLHWVLLDFGDLVAHIFLQETRDYYELERLWGDVPKVDWTEGAA